MIGQTVASYEIVEELGRGGMGIVYRAHDRRLRRDVALKVLHPERVSDTKRQRRFMREARTASSLAHPGIVTVFDIVEHGQSYALVMELVPGVPLRRLLDSGPLPWRRCASLGVQLAEAVRAAHREGIVHRDLKPENVMVAAGDRVKVLDFGIAKLNPLVSPSDDGGYAESGDGGETVLSSLSHDKALGAGTLAYMAPEQALAERVDPRTDIFAFGVLLYEMSSGQKPFRGSTPISAIRTLLYDDPLPLARLRPDLPSELAELVARCLEKRAEDRPRGLDEVARILRRLLGTADRAPSVRETPAPAPPGTSTIPETLAEQPRVRAGAAARRTPAVPSAAPAAGSTRAEAEREGSPEATTEDAADPTTIAAPQGADSPIQGTSIAPGPVSAPAVAPDDSTPAASTPRASKARRGGWPWAAGLAALALGLALLRGFGFLAPGPLPESERRPEAIPAGAADASAYDHFRRARTLLDRYDLEGHVEQAIEALGLALEKDPSHAAAHALLAEAYCRKYVIENADPMWLDHALGNAEKGVELGSFLAVTHRSLARVRLLQGDPTAAAVALDRAELLEPLHPDASILRGSAFEKLGRPEEAERALRRAVELGPGDREAHDFLGSLLFQLGRYEEAEASFRRAVELAPDSYIGHRNLAGALQLQGRYTEAASALQRSLEIRPTASSYSNLGTLHFYAGLYGEAVRAYEQAIDLGANHYLIWGNLGDAYRFDPAHRGEAAIAYRRAIQLAREQLPQSGASAPSPRAAGEGSADPAEKTLRSRIALFLAKAGEPEAALEELARLSLEGAEPALLLRALTVRELAGERDAALGLLERWVGSGYPTGALGEDPELVELRRDPRYHRILARASELRLDPG